MGIFTPVAEMRFDGEATAPGGAKDLGRRDLAAPVSTKKFILVRLSYSQKTEVSLMATAAGCR